MIPTHSSYPAELEKYKTKSTRFKCPNCETPHSLARYINTRTGEYLPMKYGRCNRQDKCGYHLSPYHDGYFSSDHRTDDFVPAPLRKQIPSKPVIDLPKELLIETLKNNQNNSLVKHLLTLFPADLVSHLRAEYLIGDHNIWPGATCFPFVSIEGYIRAIQIKQLDGSGHTAKNEDGSSRTIWIHKLVDKATHWLKAYEEQDMRLNCLFAEHLLAKYPKRDVALFEAPKTAIIAAPYFPNMVCLAVGALDWLTLDRVQALKGRRVILYPDASIDGKAFRKWSEKAEKWQHLAEFSISSYLEMHCSDEEKAKGFDFADLLESIQFSGNIIENQIIALDGQENKLHHTALSDDEKETNRWETGTGEKMHFSAPIQSEIGLPKIMEAPHPIEKWSEEGISFETRTIDAIETPVSVQTSSIDIEEYRRWARKLGSFPKGEFIRLDSMASDAPYNTVFNPRAFAMGRLNSIAAWSNARNDSGPKALHIRQIIELRQKLSINQNNQ